MGADASTGQGPKEGRRGAAVKRSSDAGIGLLEERIRPVLTKVGPLWHSALSLAALQRCSELQQVTFPIPGICIKHLKAEGRGGMGRPTLPREKIRIVVAVVVVVAAAAVQ